MTRLFDDEQSSSLITSMMNPESNASKFIEQGEDIGLPRDVTMDILNKYATYGANTGIGSLGGERLVKALNEEYRKQVDAPLQEMSKEAFFGGFVDLLSKLGDAATDISKIKELFGGEKTASSKDLAALDAVAAPGVEAASIIDAGATGGALNSPISLPGSEKAANPLLPETTRLEKFSKYLEDNPNVARVLERSGTDVAKLIGSAIGGRDKDSKTSFRAPRPRRLNPRQIRTQRIGMSEGGKPEEGSVLGRTLFIQGGEVDGPGGPTEDLVPIWASDREYVVSEKGVKNMGGGDFEKGIAALDKINFGKA
tara:strand:+ start:43 stop:975 length:933 start_codon:yes stop_codon:yes gene_type:complete